MVLIRRRANRLESVISVFLLAVLLITGVGVFLRQADYDISRFGVGKAAVQQSSRTAQANQKEKMDFSPLIPAGFEAFSDIEVYNSENLFEKIDGKAPLYTESGFEKLFAQRFVNKDEPQLVMELYVFDMGTMRNAFSVCSLQRRTDAQVVSLFQPSFGYRTANALYFIHGRYYVELIGFSESERLIEAMEEVAGGIQQHFAGGDDGRPAEMELFPKENLVEGSIKLYLTDCFGFNGLTDTFAARYRFGQEMVTAFLSKRASPDDAMKVFGEYCKFLLTNGGEEITTADPQTKVVNLYGTFEIVSVAGPFVFGIHEAEDRGLAEKAKEMIFKKIIETAAVHKSG